ncbi:TetR/AcrR family transcriptional regulator [Brevundimonas sp.]|uniref:TetR/AcrR family transcriptional regulator n=1 Tax=Brevundimonas sp. TaxID=1871086 RepID=UPI0025BE944F|nr:TetR/AcrR family transcriptional regulator [Brevundimonas sp.]
MSDQARKTGARKTASTRVRTRTNDPDATKANILEVATKEFAERGFDGARIDAIADRTKTSKRMIYYYFGHKKGLYQAVLTNYYIRLRQAESEIDLEDLSALEAVEKLTHSTFDYHMRNADVVRLVMVENIAKGRHIDELPSLDPISSVLIKTLKKVCQRGYKEGVMRKVDPTRLYMSIAALCFFNVSNRYTFQKIFNLDLISPRAAELRKAEVADMIIRYVRS